LNDHSQFMIPSPVSGQIIEINKELKTTPYALKKQNFDQCWIARIEPFNLEQDLHITPTRNITFISDSNKKENPYLTSLIDLGCKITRANSTDTFEALKEDQSKVLILDAISVGGQGPDIIEKINQKFPEARIIIIDKPDSGSEELYRNKIILYYCIDSYFDTVISDLIACSFTSIHEDTKTEYAGSDFLPQTVRGIQISNRHGKKVSLIISGDVIKKNAGIGNILFNRLIEQASPVEIIHGIDCAESNCPSEQERIDNEKDKNDRIIVLSAKDLNKIPGQLLKKSGQFTNIFRPGNSMIHLFIQPNNIMGKGQTDFGNVTNKAIAEIILNEMTRE